MGDSNIGGIIMNFLKLQNGSDIRGIALSGVKGEKINLTSDICGIIAKYFAYFLSKIYRLTQLQIAVGMDSRLSGPEISQAVCEALKSIGVKVFDCGLSTTPSMFFTCLKEGLNCHGAIMITASHLPFNRNGLKFFTKKGSPEKEDITEILTYCENRPKILDIFDKEEITKIDFLTKYSNMLIDKIRKEVNSVNYQKPLENLKILVDAGNGAGGFYAEKVLKELGAEYAGSLYLEPDGNFPNHIPNPESKDALKDISNAVITNNADLGIIFDTDVDRAAIIDKNGREINRNKLIALISAIVLKYNPGSTIVTDSITSSALGKFISRSGGVHHRFKRGYKNVINESISLNEKGINCELAIETSGHCALKENYFLDDGAYLVSKILIEYAKCHQNGEDLFSIIESLEEPKEEAEIRIPVKNGDFKKIGEKIIEDLKIYAANNLWNIETPNYEGIRIAFDKGSGDGWFLLRMSLHDPVIPVNIESNTIGGVKIIASKLYEFLEIYKDIDIANLSDFMIK